MSNNMKWKSFWRKAWAFALALCLSLSLCPQLIGTAYAVGEAAMDKLLNWGVVGGYPDGGLHPERSLTRAEFVAMVNRAYGYTQTGATPFIDVPNTAWFYDDIGIAYNANYFGGVSPRMAAPDSSLTREQAMVLLARNMRLDPVAGEVTEFADGRNFADWSRGYARAAAQMGLIGGYGDGSYKPQNNISRGEMGIMLQRALGTLVNTPGTHTLSDTYGNVTISSTGTTLKDTTIAGNLYITGGLDLGDITLDNVRVLGDIIVAGGGESQSGESIILRNVEADSLLVDSIADQYVSLRAEGNTEIADTLLRSDAFVQDRTRPGNGLLNVSLESPDVPASFTLSGNLENVVNKTPGSLLNIAMGTVDTLTIDEKARDSTLNLDVNSTASTLNLDTATNVSGIGDIDKLFVNAAGSTVEMLPDDITIRPGLTASIAGETMNATQAQESSTDPRLLAGYPKLRNVAPTNATGVYSANKAGTVYWAVSATVDGSVAEEELITPTEGNAQGNVARLPYGNLAIAASDTEVTAAIANLTPDGNYYLSAVMTDARGRKSPVKVVSFVTPDNTTPAFNAGYPVVSQNEWEYERNEDKSIKTENGKPVINYHVQVSAMPNKNCTLYYVLYDQGSTAPTAQQFRIGALGAPLQSGTQDAVKNYINYVDFDGLDELKTYDAYFCLIDADGSRSSAVQKLTFTTAGVPVRNARHHQRGRHRPDPERQRQRKRHRVLGRQPLRRLYQGPQRRGDDRSQMGRGALVGARHASDRKRRQRRPERQPRSPQRHRQHAQHHRADRRHGLLYLLRRQGHCRQLFKVYEGKHLPAAVLCQRQHAGQRSAHGHAGIHQPRQHRGEQALFRHEHSHRVQRARHAVLDQPPQRTRQL